MAKNITNQHLFNCVNTAGIYMNLVGSMENKLTYALRRFIKANQAHINSYNDSTAYLHIQYASTRPDGNLIRDEYKNLCYTKENQGKLNEEIKNLNNKEIGVEVFLIKDADIPKDVPLPFMEIFDGIVINVPATETASE